MKLRQIVCYVVAVIAFAVMVLEAVVGGSWETLRIFAGTSGVAGGAFVIAHIP